MLAHTHAHTHKHFITRAQYSDWLSVEFDFTPSFDEFCQKFDANGTECEYYYRSAGNTAGHGYVTEEFQMIFEFGELDYDNADKFYMGYTGNQTHALSWPDSCFSQRHSSKRTYTHSRARLHAAYRQGDPGQRGSQKSHA